MHTGFMILLPVVKARVVYNIFLSIFIHKS